MNSTGNKVQLNVLIACEESQAECSAFRKLGHNAFSCDIQPCKKKGNPDWHILGDVTPLLGGLTKFTTQSGCTVEVSRWDLIIAHPPCTYLCKVSSVHMRHEPDMIYEIGGKKESLNSARFIKMIEARCFFFKCLNAAAKYVAVENPIPMGIAQLPKPNDYTCPSWFGCKYTKKTCY